MVKRLDELATWLGEAPGSREELGGGAIGEEARQSRASFGNAFVELLEQQDVCGDRSLSFDSGSWGVRKRVEGCAQDTMQVVVKEDAPVAPSRKCGSKNWAGTARVAGPLEAKSSWWPLLLAGR